MGVLWPTHAHLLGLNARHPEDAFDVVRETARQGMTVEELSESEAFATGLLYLREGYFWEAHEVLEPVWLALPETSAERVFVQGLIQLANGLLKEKMGRPNAARRLCAIAREQLSAGSGDLVMGVRKAEAQGRVESLNAYLRSAQ